MNIFEQGCLIQLSVSKWGGVKKLSKDQIAKMVENGNTDWVSATKKLVDPESLKPICKVTNTARSWLASISLPFPIPGMVFVPRDLIERVDETLSQYRSEFWGKVNAFQQDYAWLREKARLYLGELFNEVDYPLDIEKPFSFAWRFVILDVPNGNTRILAPEVYEREKEKFIQTMEEARGMAIEALREEFAQMVERISDRFTTGPDGKPKVFKNSTVQSFYEYFETFRDRNIFQDEALSELVDQAQRVLSGRSAEEIRNNQNLREQIRQNMASIEETMGEVFNQPRRKIRIE
ncbi:MAG: DUF3150 domain-containing protein [Desulfovermiculus sp.]|nr:DUF3150 domain-containing protein [Desulfovermiculus sp.]